MTRPGRELERRGRVSRAWKRGGARRVFANEYTVRLLRGNLDASTSDGVARASVVSPEGDLTSLFVTTCQHGRVPSNEHVAESLSARISIER